MLLSAQKAAKPGERLMAKEMTRIMTGLILVAGILAMAMAIRPDWLTGLKPQTQAARSIIQHTPSDEHSQILCRRIKAKSDIVNLVITGELALTDAARHFQFVNSQPANFPDRSWRRLEGRDDGEKLCRQVLQWTVVELRNRFTESEVELRLARLERELLNHIATHGGVQLESE